MIKRTIPVILLSILFLPYQITFAANRSTAALNPVSHILVSRVLSSNTSTSSCVPMCNSGSGSYTPCGASDGCGGTCSGVCFGMGVQGGACTSDSAGNHVCCAQGSKSYLGTCCQLGQNVCNDGCCSGACGSNGNCGSSSSGSSTFTFVPTILAEAGSGGSISPSGAVSAISGGSKTFTITPQTGFITSQILVDGTTAIDPTLSSYTFSNIRTNHTISVNFSSPLKYHIYTSTSGNGTLTFAGPGCLWPGLAIEGSSVTFTATPGSGAVFNSWGGDCVSQGSTSSPYTCTLTANSTLYESANFQAADLCSPGEKSVNGVCCQLGQNACNDGCCNFPCGANGLCINYSGLVPILQSSSNSGGTISPLGEIQLASGKSQTFTITPNTGYTVSQVLIDGNTSLSGISSYTFSNVTAYHSIRVTFAPVQYTISTSTSGNGTLDCGGSACMSLVDAGTPVTFRATPCNGASFGSWGGACSIQGSTSGPYTCSLTANSNLSVSATFNCLLSSDCSSGFCYNSTCSPTASVFATLMDDQTNAPLKATDTSKVVITQGPQNPAPVVTPGMGSFQMTHLIPGTYNLVVSSMGHTASYSLIITAGDLGSAVAKNILIPMNTNFFAKVTANNGLPVTSQLGVGITMSASYNGASVSQMQFSNDNEEWSPPESYTTYKRWLLPPDVGQTYTIYSKFKNSAGQWSDLYANSITVTSSQNTNTNPYIRGDINGDGKVNGQDLVLLQQYVAANPTPLTSFNFVYDVNGDGVVDQNDIDYLSAYLTTGGPQPPLPYPTAAVNNIFSCSKFPCIVADFNRYVQINITQTAQTATTAEWTASAVDLTDGSTILGFTLDSTDLANTTSLHLTYTGAISTGATDAAIPVSYTTVNGSSIRAEINTTGVQTILGYFLNYDSSFDTLSASNATSILTNGAIISNLPSNFMKSNLNIKSQSVTAHALNGTPPSGSGNQNYPRCSKGHCSGPFNLPASNSSAQTNCCIQHDTCYAIGGGQAQYDACNAALFSCLSCVNNPSLNLVPAPFPLLQWTSQQLVKIYDKMVNNSYFRWTDPNACSCMSQQELLAACNASGGVPPVTNTSDGSCSCGGGCTAVVNGQSGQYSCNYQQCPTNSYASCCPSCKNTDGSSYECGDDGCGGSCGSCGSNSICSNHVCEPVCDPQACLKIQYDLTTHKNDKCVTICGATTKCDGHGQCVDIADPMKCQTSYVDSNGKGQTFDNCIYHLNGDHPTYNESCSACDTHTGTCQSTVPPCTTGYTAYECLPPGCSEPGPDSTYDQLEAFETCFDKGSCDPKTHDCSPWQITSYSWNAQQNTSCGTPQKPVCDEKNCQVAVGFGCASDLNKNNCEGCCGGKHYNTATESCNTDNSTYWDIEKRTDCLMCDGLGHAVSSCNPDQCETCNTNTGTCLVSCQFNSDGTARMDCQSCDQKATEFNSGAASCYNSCQYTDASNDKATPLQYCCSGTCLKANDPSYVRSGCGAWCAAPS